MTAPGWLAPGSRPTPKEPDRFPWSGVAAFVAVGLFLWYGWLWLFQGKAVGSALVVGPLLVVFTAPLILGAARRWPTYDIGGLLLLGLLMRLFGAYQRSENAIDAVLYHRTAVDLAAYYRSFNFGVATGGKVPGTGAMRAIAGMVHVITADDYFASFLFFTWLGFLGAYLLYRAFEIAIPDGDRPRYAKLIMLWPSMCFWPSSIGKDAWMVFTIGLASYGAARVFQRMAGGYTFLGIGLLAASFVRPHLALLAIVAFTIALLIGRRDTAHTSVTPSVVAKFVGVILVIVIGSVLVSRTQQLLAIEDFSAASIETASNYVEGQTSLGGSAYAPVNPRTPTGFPQALVTVLFRPFPFEARGFEQLFSSLEGLGLAALTLASFRRLATIPRRLRRQPYLTYAGIYVLLWTLAFGVIANFGILARQRTQMLPFFFVLVAVPAVTSRRRREAERRVLR